MTARAQLDGALWPVVLVGVVGFGVGVTGLLGVLAAGTPPGAFAEAAAELGAIATYEPAGDRVHGTPVPGEDEI